MPASDPLPFRLLLITDRRSCRSPLPEQVARSLDGDGAGVAVLLRDKDLAPGPRASLAERLRRVTDDVGAKLLIHGDLALARAVGADGLHASDDATGRQLLRDAGADWLIGASCHGPTGVHDAARAGARYATLSPILPSPGKAEPGEELGKQALGGPFPVPVFALGGMSAVSCAEALAAGAWGIAAIRAFLDPVHGAAAVRSCREILLR